MTRRSTKPKLPPPKRKIVAIACCHPGCRGQTHVFEGEVPAYNQSSGMRWTNTPQGWDCGRHTARRDYGEEA